MTLIVTHETVKGDLKSAVEVCVSKSKVPVDASSLVGGQLRQYYAKTVVPVLDLFFSRLMLCKLVKIGQIAKTPPSLGLVAE